MQIPAFSTIWNAVTSSNGMGRQCQWMYASYAAITLHLGGRVCSKEAALAPKGIDLCMQAV